MRIAPPPRTKTLRPQPDRKPATPPRQVIPDKPTLPHFEAYAGRQCFMCHAEGDCPHREKQAASAALKAFREAYGETVPGPAPPCPQFRYLDPALNRDPVSPDLARMPASIGRSGDGRPTQPQADGEGRDSAEDRGPRYYIHLASQSARRAQQEWTKNKESSKLKKGANQCKFQRTMKSQQQQKQ